MKRILSALFLTLIMSAAFSCGEKKPSITWETRTAAVNAAIEGDRIDISYPFAEGPGEMTDAINRTIVSAIATLIGAEEEDSDIGHMADMILEDRNLDTLISHIRYEMSVKGEARQYGNLVVVMLDVYTFYAGAHGLNNIVYLNFDARDGRALALSDIFTDMPALTEVNRLAFIDHYPDLAHSQETMLFVETDKIPMPENAGLNRDGLHVRYNQYEIAPYVFGPTEYTIPISDIRKFINKDFL